MPPVPPRLLELPKISPSGETYTLDDRDHSIIYLNEVKYAFAQPNYAKRLIISYKDQSKRSDLFYYDNYEAKHSLLKDEQEINRLVGHTGNNIDKHSKGEDNNTLLKRGEMIAQKFIWLPESIGSTYIRTTNIYCIEKWKYNSERSGFRIYYKDGSYKDIKYSVEDEKISDQDYERLKEVLSKHSLKEENTKISDKENTITKIIIKEKKSMIDKLKEYYKQHEDIIFPLLIVVAIDYFFNDGRCQKKIKNMIEGMLDTISSKFERKMLPEGENKDD